MLLGRLFSYPDTHRHRIGTNYQQLPINRPKSSVNTYNKDGAMRYNNPGDPVYAPNNYGGPEARPEEHGESHIRWSMGELMRTPYPAHRDDNDFVQPGTLVREVLTEREVDHLVDNLVGHIRDGVTDEVKTRVIEYWRSVDKDLGDRISQGLGHERVAVGSIAED